jgi:hypothetical protein
MLTWLPQYLLTERHYSTRMMALVGWLPFCATAAGKWTGLQNGVGNLAGIVAPIVTGFIVERTGEFYFAFVWVSVLLLVGALSYLLIIRKVAPVSWENSVGNKNAYGAISSGTF